MIIRGGCHCGAVRFRAEAPDQVELLDCNCSICSKTGFLHLILPHGDFVLERGDAVISAYRFGTGTAEHLFCSICGIKSFYQPRSHPDCWSVNYRALDPETVPEAQIISFDGRNWEAGKESLNRNNGLHG